MSLDFKIKWNEMSQVGRTETHLGLLESARNSILLATVLYLMNYSSLSMFPDVSPFSRLLLGHPELHRSHTESRVSLHALSCNVLLGRVNNKKKKLKKLLETLSLYAMVSDSWCHKGPLQAITHALAHTAQETALRSLSGLRLPQSLSLAIAGINFVLTWVRSIWKTIDQNQSLATYRWIGWSHLQSTVTTSLL